jgi:exopolysaccharide biosynthesis polyprenyl glycosylphosphotransferase
MLIKTKQKILITGDALILGLSLWLALFIRYGHLDEQLSQLYIVPSFIILASWLITFYIIGWYDIKNLKNNYKLIEKITIGILVGVIIAIIIFYLTPSFKITPKTILIIFSSLALVLEIIWRLLFNIFLTKPQFRVLIIGNGKEIDELISFFKQHQQLGYQVCGNIIPGQETPIDLFDTIKKYKINTILISKTIEDQEKLFVQIYDNLIAGIEIMDITTAYESILKKMPLSELQQVWILTNLSKTHRIYEVVKRPLEFIIALILLLLLSPLMLITFLLVKITSAGPGLYKQMRIGKNEKLFLIYKYRTMIKDAEKNGHQWSNNNDQRVTTFGQFLRLSHLDELPQLINIIKGELSFVGPRPERPEFVADLKQKIPYYETRHLIKPGLTGWAQINYHYGSSIEDSYAKLQYDIFYLKNRSLVFDVLILLKTIKSFFSNPT